MKCPGLIYKLFSALGMEPTFLKIRNDIMLILIEIFHLPELENDRNEFFKSIEKKK